MGMRASSLSVPSRLCCNSRVVRCLRPWKAPSSTKEIWFCCKSRVVKLSYPKKAPSWRTLIRLRAKRRCLGCSDQVCEAGMERRCRSWQSTKTSWDSINSEHSEGPDLLWRPAPLTLKVLKHTDSEFMACHSWHMVIRVGEKWCEQITAKFKSIPVSCELVSCSSEASAPPWFFHLDGWQQEEEEQGG